MSQLMRDGVPAGAMSYYCLRSVTPSDTVPMPTPKPTPTAQFDAANRIARIPSAIRPGCTAGEVNSEHSAGDVTDCPWAEGKAEITYVYFDNLANLREWWQDERAGVPKREDTFERCRSGQLASGPWYYDDDFAGRLACDFVGSPPRWKLSWTDEEALVGYRLVHDNANPQSLLRRWKDDEFDVTF